MADDPIALLDSTGTRPPKPNFVLHLEALPRRLIPEKYVEVIAAKLAERSRRKQREASANG